MRVVLVIDPWDQQNPKTATSYEMVHQSVIRGNETYTTLLSGLYAVNGVPFAEARRVQTFPDRPMGQHYKWLGPPEQVNLRDADVIFMRKAPPFDMEFIYATYVLDLAQPYTPVYNRPQGLRDCNEKAYIFHFPELIMPTMMSSDVKRLFAFHAEHGDCVVKPLDAYGGEGVLLLRKGDLNVRSILDVMTRLGTRTIMIQLYIPESQSNERRLTLLDGELVASLSRNLGDGLRANCDAGGWLDPGEINERDREICAAMAPRLRADGHLLVGLDVLGDWVCEINVTAVGGTPFIRDRWCQWIA